MSTTLIPFTKMAGTGNDFLIVRPDARLRRRFGAQWAAAARQWCDRRLGVGADGLLVIEPSRRADSRLPAALRLSAVSSPTQAGVAQAGMRIFNTDGSEAEMCGNGARCVARYLISASPRGTRGHATVDTCAGVLRADVRGDHVAITMPAPRDLRLSVPVQLRGRRLHVHSVNTGVPHAVVPVVSLSRMDVASLGRQLRFHPAFQPAGTNVNFMEADARHPNRVKIRTYERGVEGETLACGTGATASAILYAVANETNGASGRRQVTVETQGGDTLMISFSVRRPAGRWQISDVVLAGAVRWICQGVVPWPIKGGR